MTTIYSPGDRVVAIKCHQPRFLDLGPVMPGDTGVVIGQTGRDKEIGKITVRFSSAGFRRVAVTSIAPQNSNAQKEE